MTVTNDDSSFEQANTLATLLYYHHHLEGSWLTKGSYTVELWS